MFEVGYFVWKVSSMPKDPMELVKICRQFGIKRLAFKVLEKFYKYNVPSGDRPLIDYFDVLRSNGIVVEGWGYHYPDQPGPQGDAIEERRQKLGFSTYHVNCETEWKQPFGMPAAAKLLLSKPKVNNFEMLLCSFRFPSLHAPFPFNAFMLHETINGASPQIYWALANNPREQLAKSLIEYQAWDKPVFPIGPTFGAYFNGIWWEPTAAALVEFREACIMSGIPRIYYYSLDWALANSRWDWLEASTGINDDEPPVDPPIPQPEEWFTITNCTWLNGRSQPTASVDNKIITIRAGQVVENLNESSGDWKKVGLGHLVCWMHGDYLDS